MSIDGIVRNCPNCGSEVYCSVWERELHKCPNCNRIWKLDKGELKEPTEEDIDKEQQRMAAQNRINNSRKGCYIATAVYGSYDCPQVWTLRRYRDYTLAETWYGRLFIRVYYAISPALVRRFGKIEWFKNLWKPKLDRMVERLNNEGVENTPYADRDW